MVRPLPAGASSGGGRQTAAGHRRRRRRNGGGSRDLIFTADCITIMLAIFPRKANWTVMRSTNSYPISNAAVLDAFGQQMAIESKIGKFYTWRGARDAAARAAPCDTWRRS